jgi:hypothetical protein
MAAATTTRQAALKNSSLSLAPTDLFSAQAHGLEHAADGGITHPNYNHSSQELASLGKSDCLTLL